MSEPLSDDELGVIERHWQSELAGEDTSRLVAALRSERVQNAELRTALARIDAFAFADHPATCNAAGCVRCGVRALARSALSTQHPQP